MDEDEEFEGQEEISRREERCGRVCDGFPFGAETEVAGIEECLYMALFLTEGGRALEASFGLEADGLAKIWRTRVLPDGAVAVSSRPANGEGPSKLEWVFPPGVGFAGDEGATRRAFALLIRGLNMDEVISWVRLIRKGDAESDEDWAVAG
ncbi:MAG: hypothetical protein H8E78_03500 [Proteobacteria bacterium]|nr:hypothetical protein [Pseudomonadota bacterium]